MTKMTRKRSTKRRNQNTERMKGTRYCINTACTGLFSLLPDTEIHVIVKDLIKFVDLKKATQLNVTEILIIIIMHCIIVQIK